MTFDHVTTFNLAIYAAARELMTLTKNSVKQPEGKSDVTAEANAFGRYQKDPAKHWSDRIWINLVGASALSLYQGVSLEDVFAGIGRADFFAARRILGEMIYPRIPEHLQKYLGDDVASYLDTLSGIEFPAEVQGLLKRRITLFTKECLLADSKVCEWIYAEARQLQVYMQGNPWLLRVVEQIATRFVESAQPTNEVMIAVCQNLEQLNKAA
jgi:hypothetical protein